MNDRQIDQHAAAWPWYFVCPVCTAKWFCEADRCRCPRCSTSVNSNERMKPPWWKLSGKEIQPSSTNMEDHLS